MAVVSPEQMEDAWKFVGGCSKDEVLALQQRCGRFQEELTCFVLGFTSDVSSDALGLALWVHLVLMQAFQRNSSKLARVKPAKIERAWRQNTMLFNAIRIKPDVDPYELLIELEEAEPAVIQYVVDALTESDPDDLIAMSEQDRWHIMQVLKTVSDCLHGASRVQ
jgi:hypothetical protein